MKTELKAKWLEALRSGKYQQGRHKLRTKEEKFCCLGVLCDIVAPERWRDFDEKMWSVTRKDGYRFEGCPPHDLYPEYVEDLMSSDDHQGILIQMNDNGKSFEEIARYIEEKM